MTLSHRHFVAKTHSRHRLVAGTVGHRDAFRVRLMTDRRSRNDKWSIDNTIVVNTSWEGVSGRGTSLEFAGGWMDDGGTIQGRSIFDFVEFTYKYMQSIHAFITFLHIYAHTTFIKL